MKKDSQMPNKNITSIKAHIIELKSDIGRIRKELGDFRKHYNDKFNEMEEENGRLREVMEQQLDRLNIVCKFARFPEKFR